MFQVYLTCLVAITPLVQAAGGLKLFGTLESIHIDDGTISIIIIICAVLATEHLFEYMHIMTHDTPFQDMVSAIEKELMIVGCMAFIFKIVINVTHVEYNWLFALEYSGMLF